MKKFLHSGTQTSVNYQTDQYAIKQARKNTFWLWFSTSYLNKQDIQLSGMR